MFKRLLYMYFFIFDVYVKCVCVAFYNKKSQLDLITENFGSINIIHINFMLVCMYHFFYFFCVGSIIPMKRWREIYYLIHFSFI